MMKRTSVSLAEETGVPGGDHRPTASITDKPSHTRLMPSPSTEPAPQRYWMNLVGFFLTNSCGHQVQFVNGNRKGSVLVVGINTGYIMRFVKSRSGVYLWRSGVGVTEVTPPPPTLPSYEIFISNLHQSTRMLYHAPIWTVLTVGLHNVFSKVTFPPWLHPVKIWRRTVSG